MMEPLNQTNAASKTSHIYLVARIQARFPDEQFTGDEAAFSSEEKAMQHMQSMIESDLEDGEEPEYISYEVTTLPLDGTDCLEWRHYNMRGELIHHYVKGKDTVRQGGPIDYQRKFAPGDLVWILPSNLHPYSYPKKKTLGAVFVTPTQSPPADFRPDHFFDEYTYIVYFINRNGYADHCHVPECCLEPATEPVPEDQEFLLYWAEHFKGTIELPSEVVGGVEDQKLFVLKVKTFDFAAAELLLQNSK